MSKLKPPVNSSDRFLGDEHAPVELVEFGDYQCPDCGHAYQIIKNIQQKLAGKLKFIFRNFPSAENHPDAMGAAIAAEAAALQGKFWEMHDILFENQNNLDAASLVEYAKRIGLNVGEFEAELENPASNEKVDNDFESGSRSRVESTPAFFINGVMYEGSWEEEALLDYLMPLVK